MLTVALVGGDGAGKTSIAERLVRTSPWRVKYLYMGLSTLSSDHPLPTSRLARAVKLRALRKRAAGTGGPAPESTSSHEYHYASQAKSAVWLAVRLFNRLAEAGYRHILSLSYRCRGYIVVYDRHFFFDTPPRETNFREFRREALWDRLQAWALTRFFPRPGLVVFLDAPAEVLYERKKEAGIAYLEERRAIILERAWMVPRFARVDASRPLDLVYADVLGHIQKLAPPRTRGGSPLRPAEAPGKEHGPQGSDGRKRT